MTFALTRVASSSAARRVVTGRHLSTAAPKMHKAKDLWPAMMELRPTDPDDDHKVFHPPFNKLTVLLLVGGTVGFGWGSMAYGVHHQQRKQGFIK